MTKIINDNLNQLTLYQRPLHCTDKKRNDVYTRRRRMEQRKGKAKKKIFEGFRVVAKRNPRTNGMEEYKSGI